jgi:hypothetical protein
MPPPEKSSTAKSEHKPNDQKPTGNPNPPASDWKKESEPHIPSVISEHGTGGGQDSGPPSEK